MDAEHLFLFSELIHKGRISIRDNNPALSKYHELRALGLCSILESGRKGTLVIHPTNKAEILAKQFISNLNAGTNINHDEGTVLIKAAEHNTVHNDKLIVKVRY